MFAGGVVSDDRASRAVLHALVRRSAQATLPTGRETAACPRGPAPRCPAGPRPPVRPRWHFGIEVAGMASWATPPEGCADELLFLIGLVVVVVWRSCLA